MPWRPVLDISMCRSLLMIFLTLLIHLVSSLDTIGRDQVRQRRSLRTTDNLFVQEKMHREIPLGLDITVNFELCLDVGVGENGEDNEHAASKSALNLLTFFWGSYQFTKNWHALEENHAHSPGDYSLTANSKLAENQNSHVIPPSDQHFDAKSEQQQFLDYPKLNHPVIKKVLPISKREEIPTKCFLIEAQMTILEQTGFDNDKNEFVAALASFLRSVGKPLSHH